MVWVWDWIPRNTSLISTLLVEHVQLSLVPVVVGLVVAVPLGWLANHTRVARSVLIPTSGLLYTIPSLALFVLLPGLLGLQVSNSLNVIIALALYTVALLVRSIADALAAVPAMVVAAATAMGFRPGRRFVAVELPLAVPVLIAGLRVATVSNISLVSVGALIGNGGLGELFTDGIQRSNIVEIITGIVLIVVLALAADAVLLGIGRVATPWNRVGSGSGGGA
ncbi:ABC transporter permease [Pseudonocardia sp. MH-G8]|uniref:ABC transporter permease n=1 Tax=Pseudonocardia sp. MH-G8 TaxID=1854588 RepID=UPI000BA090FF|nr:ABC transporter permease subunit [Pseudonocardia sp. MH-G8]OZM82013.1 ABC transporter permease [Pseudonocardia sp. MH-G8]